MGAIPDPDAQHARVRSTTIAQLNDDFRKTLEGGQIVITHGVAALGASGIAGILETVRTFSKFTPDNDPHGEHDFGSCSWGLHRILWKIDYYDVELEYGSPDPTDPSLTRRVLTIMLAAEY